MTASSSWVFGYGSLVSPPSLAHTLERAVDTGTGWAVAHLAGFGRRWNYGSLTLRGNWCHGDDHVRGGVVISLGLVEAEEEWCNGTAVRVTADELDRLDWRERDYERTDVTARITTESAAIDGRVFTYVPRASALARYEFARDDGRAAVRRAYWDLVHDAFADLGTRHLDHLSAHTPAPDVPIADVTLLPH